MTATATTPQVSAITGPCDPSHLRVFRAATRAEWTKMRSVRSTIWTLLVAVVLAVGFSALVAATHINTWDTLDPIEQARLRSDIVQPQRLVPRPARDRSARRPHGHFRVRHRADPGHTRRHATTPHRPCCQGDDLRRRWCFVVGLVLSFSAFGIGQAIFSSKGIDASLNDPGVLRAVIGGALYLADSRCPRARTRHHHPTHRRSDRRIRRPPRRPFRRQPTSSRHHGTNTSRSTSPPAPAWPYSTSSPTPRRSHPGPVSQYSWPTRPSHSSPAGCSSHATTRELTSDPPTTPQTFATSARDLHEVCGRGRIGHWHVQYRRPGWPESEGLCPMWRRRP